MSADVSKTTPYALAGPASARIATAKATPYFLVRPAGSVPGPARRRRVAVSSRITYSEG